MMLGVCSVDVRNVDMHRWACTAYLPGHAENVSLFSWRKLIIDDHLGKKTPRVLSYYMSLDHLKQINIWRLMIKCSHILKGKPNDQYDF
jgi:hypothetical protein